MADGCADVQWSMLLMDAFDSVDHLPPPFCAPPPTSPPPPPRAAPLAPFPSGGHRANGLRPGSFLQGLQRGGEYLLGHIYSPKEWSCFHVMPEVPGGLRYINALSPELLHHLQEQHSSGSPASLLASGLRSATKPLWAAAYGSCIYLLARL